MSALSSAALPSIGPCIGQALSARNAVVSRVVAKRREPIRSREHLSKRAGANCAALAVTEEEEEESDNNWSMPTPEEDDPAELSPKQVEALLSTLCNETEIAELKLDLGSNFHLKVTRAFQNTTAVAPPTTPAPALPSAQSVPFANSGAISSDDEAEEVRLVVRASKVGKIRYGKFVKGKRVSPEPTVKVGDQVKKGQVICYTEQLGTVWPLEAPQAGELREFLVKEGEALERSRAQLNALKLKDGRSMSATEIRKAFAKRETSIAQNLESMTLKSVRQQLADDMGVDPDSLKAHKDLIASLVDK
ncbi:hypothetical protein H632_c2086p0, partial [Helicosporidium sp. ATCC 50920]